MITRERGRKGARDAVSRELAKLGSDELGEARRGLIQWVLVRIPELVRKELLPFLTVQDTLRLDTAVACGQDNERENLQKAYMGLRSPGFDGHMFSSNNDYEGFHWAYNRGIDLRNLKLEYHGWEKKNANHVLARLVVDENKEMATHYAERNEEVNDVAVEFENGDFSTTLIEASRHGYSAVVQCLLGRGADVNKSGSKGSFPLFTASTYGHIEIVRALLSAGAELGMQNSRGDTCLLRASLGNHPEITEALVAAGGANVNTSDYFEGMTPLSWASYNGNQRAVTSLLDAGAEVNKHSNDGRTPLHQASYYGDLDTVQTLITAGADVNKRDNEGYSPLAWALARNNAGTVAMLRSVQADEPSAPARLSDWEPLYPDEEEEGDSDSEGEEDEDYYSSEGDEDFDSEGEEGAHTPQ